MSPKLFMDHFLVNSMLKLLKIQPAKIQSGWNGGYTVLLKTKPEGWVQWFTAIMPATWEVEIRRTMVQGYPGENN
jgi:hypothetical protein